MDFVFEDSPKAQLKALREELTDQLTHLKADLTAAKGPPQGPHITAVNFPLNEAAHHNQRKAFLDAVEAVPSAQALVPQHVKYKSHRTLQFRGEFSKDNIQDILMEYFHSEQLRNKIRLQLLREHWETATSSTSEIDTYRPLLDIASEATVQAQSDAAEAYRRLREAATSLIPGQSNVRADDLLQYVSALVEDAALHRQFQFFINRARWVPLGRSVEIREKMAQHAYEPAMPSLGRITDDYHFFLSMRSSTHTVLLHSDGFQSFAAQQHQQHQQLLHGEQKPTISSRPTVTEHDLIRTAFPINSPKLGENKPWVLIMAIACGLRPPKLFRAGDETALLIDVKRVFHSKFQCQTQAWDWTTIEEELASTEKKIAHAREVQASLHGGQSTATANPSGIGTGTTNTTSSAVAPGVSWSSNTSAANSSANNDRDKQKGSVLSSASAVLSLGDEKEYDATSVDAESSLRDALLVEGGHDKLVPKLDHAQEQQTSHLLALRNDLDELLKTEFSFVCKDDVEYTELQLKNRLNTVLKPPRHKKTLNVASFSGGDTFSGSVWTKMYNKAKRGKKAELDDNSDDTSGDEGEDAGDDDGEAADDDDDVFDAFSTERPRSAIKGSSQPSAKKKGTKFDGCTALFFLRHMRLRDLRIEALATLNYFVSVERFVVYSKQLLDNFAAEGGSTLDDKFFMGEERAHDVSWYQPDKYEFRNPVISVVRGSGRTIVYEEANAAMQSLEGVLLCVGTHYLRNTKAFKGTRRWQKATGRGASAKSRSTTSSIQENADVDIELYGQGQVDRSAVLLDLWMWEVAFQREKRRLLDHYKWVLLHTTDSRQREAVIRHMCMLLNKRPIYDFEASYFAESYKLACDALRLERKLLETTIADMLEREKKLPAASSRVKRQDRETAVRSVLKAKKLQRDERKRKASGASFTTSILHPNPSGKTRRATFSDLAPSSTAESSASSHQLPSKSNKNIDRNDQHHRRQHASKETGTIAVDPDTQQSTFIHDGTFLLPPLQPHTIDEGVGIISILPNTISFCVAEANRICSPSSRTEFEKMRCAVLEDLINAFLHESHPSAMLRECSDEARKLLATPSPFQSSIAVVAKVSEIVALHAAGLEKKNAEASQITQESIHMILIAMELLRNRHKLMLLFHESVVVAKLYRVICSQFHIGEHHAFLRPVTFNAATITKASDLAEPDPFISTRYDLALIELDDSMLENIRINTLADFENAVERSLSKPTRADYQPSLAKGGDGENGEVLYIFPGPLGDLQAAVHAQCLHLHLLTACVNHIDAFGGALTEEGIEAGKEVLRLTREAQDETSEVKRSPMSAAEDHGFVSFQSIKRHARAQMHDQYFTKSKSQDPFILKREMVFLYGENIAQHQDVIVGQTQLALCTSSLMALLNEFPSTRDKYFVVGSENLHARKAQKAETMLGEGTAQEKLLRAQLGDALPDADESKRKIKSTPLQILSDDAKSMLNLWYIPYLKEMISLHKPLSLAERKSAYEKLLALVGPLHDIVMYLCAHARLGSSHARLGTYDVAFQGVGADWGGAEGIGTELRKIKKEIGQLDHPENPSLVARYLSGKHQMMFREWNITVRFYVRETFLDMGNQSAYDTVSANIQTGMPPLASDFRLPHLAILPTEVLPSHLSAVQQRKRTPHALFHCTEGPFLLAHPFYSQVTHFVAMNLSKVSDMDRHTANGEVLGLSLLLEDIAEQEFGSEDKYPMKRLDLLTGFLETSGQLEQLRSMWGRIATGSPINTIARFKKFSALFDTEVVEPVVARYKRQHPHSAGERKMRNPKNPVPSTAGSLVGHGTAMELHGLPEWDYRKMLVEEIRTQIDILLVKRSIECAAAAHSQLLEESQKSSGGLLPYSIWQQANAKPPAHMSSRKRIRRMNDLDIPRHVSRCVISQDFHQEMISHARPHEADASMLVIPAAAFYKTLQGLSVKIATREKERYLAFNDLYKAVLKHVTSEYSTCERKLREARHEIDTDAIDREHKVTCGVADRTHDLVFEVTALRSQVSRLREEKKTQEQDIRERVKRDYDDLVNNLFSTSFALKNRFEEYRLSLYDDVVEGMFEVRKNALQRMKAISVGKSSKKLEMGLRRAEDLRNVQSDNAALTALVLKMRTMNDWKRTGLRSFYGQKVYQALSEANSMKKALWEAQLQLDETTVQHKFEITSLRAELVQLKKYLHNLEIVCNEERRQKQALLQWKTSKAQLIQAVEQQAKKYGALNMDVEVIIQELEGRSTEISALRDRLAQEQREGFVEKSRLKREVEQLQMQLAKELRVKQQMLEQGAFVEDEYADFEMLEDIKNIEPVADAKRKESSVLVRRQSSASNMSSPGRPFSATYHARATRRPTTSQLEQTMQQNQSRRLSRPASGVHLSKSHMGLSRPKSSLIRGSASRSSTNIHRSASQGQFDFDDCEVVDISGPPAAIARSPLRAEPLSPNNMHMLQQQQQQSLSMPNSTTPLGLTRRGNMQASAPQPSVGTTPQQQPQGHAQVVQTQAPTPPRSPRPPSSRTLPIRPSSATRPRSGQRLGSAAKLRAKSATSRKPLSAENESLADALFDDIRTPSAEKKA